MYSNIKKNILVFLKLFVDMPNPTSIMDEKGEFGLTNAGIVDEVENLPIYRSITYEKFQS